MQELEENFKHIPVLFNEVIENLNVNENGKYIDGTIGGAGHSIEIFNKLTNGTLIGIDKDKEALEVSKQRLEKELEKNIKENEDKYKNKNFILVHDDYKNIKNIVLNLDIDSIDGILLDLGISSYQIDMDERGFSYKNDGPLDMRMDQTKEKTAEFIVNTYEEKELADIIYKYGEERYSRQIASEIINVRKEKRIETTFELVNIIEKVVPYNKKDGNRSKRTFQALRIETNDELKDLEETIENAITVLKDGGRLLIITFHSLEDRIVKQKFIELEGRCTCPKEIPICVCNYTSHGIRVNRKAIIPSDEEIKNNIRSRSAKLRIFEKKG